MSRRRIVVTLLSLLLASPWSALAVVPEGPHSPLGLHALSAQRPLTEGDQVILRETYNTSRFVYVEHAGDHVVYEHDESRLFPVPEEVPVVITEIDVDDDSLEIRYRHSALGEGKIEADLDGVSQRRAAMGKVIRSAFRIPGAPDDYKPIVGNRTTKVAHFVGSNHLPDEAVRVPLADLEKAERVGMRACSICFHTVPRISSYALEERAGLECAAQIRYYYPPVRDADRQQRVETVGARVLENWPLPRKGYSYSFDLVESRDVQAVACPDGRIFVHTGLLDVIEDDAELEAILAHEVGHVEMRHYYRKVRAAQKGAFWSALAVIAAGATTAAITDNANDAATAVDIASSIATDISSIVLTGYGRGLEVESDSMAIAYLQANPGIGEALAMDQILRKVRYSVEVQGGEVRDAGLFASHPHIDERIEQAATSEASSLAGTRFVGLNDRGERVATLEFVLQSLSRTGDDSGYELLATVETKPALGEKDEIDDILVVADGHRIEMDNKEDTEIFPSDSAGVMFRTDRVRSLARRITGIQLDLRNVESWRPAPPEEARPTVRRTEVSADVRAGRVAVGDPPAGRRRAGAAPEVEAPASPAELEPARITQKGAQWTERTESAVGYVWAVELANPNPVEIEAEVVLTLHAADGTVLHIDEHTTTIPAGGSKAFTDEGEIVPAIAAEGDHWTFSLGRDANRPEDPTQQADAEANDQDRDVGPLAQVEEPVPLTEDVTPPRLIPDSADIVLDSPDLQKIDLTGKLITIRCLVRSDGTVQQARVYRIQPPMSLKAAEDGLKEAVRRSAIAYWRFEPAYRGGQAVPVWHTLTIRYEPSEGGGG